MDKNTIKDSARELRELKAALGEKITIHFDFNQTIGELLQTPGAAQRIIYQGRTTDGKKATLRTIGWGVELRGGMEISNIPLYLFRHIKEVPTVYKVIKYQLIA